jgi:hypothetical protein
MMDVDIVYLELACYLMQFQCHAPIPPPLRSLPLWPVFQHHHPLPLPLPLLQLHSRKAEGLLHAQLARTRHQLELAEKQHGVLGARIDTLEAEVAALAADRRHLLARQGAVDDAARRMARSERLLAGAAERLRAATGAGRTEGGRGGGLGGSREAPVPPTMEACVDEILTEVHRRDCQVASLVAQTQELAAALAGKVREAGEMRAAMQALQATAGRTGEECVRLAMELGQREQQLARMQAEGGATGR